MQGSSADKLTAFACTISALFVGGKFLCNRCTSVNSNLAWSQQAMVLTGMHTGKPNEGS